MNGDKDSPTLKHIVVPRTARYAMLGEPGPHTAEVWIVCHGYAQLASRFIERFRPIASPERLIVAPEALSRFYSDRGAGFHGPSSQVSASWMTSEDRESEITDYISYLDAVYDELFAVIPRATVPLRVLGFSQGTSTVARWLAKGRARADQVILWAGSIPPELSAEEGRRLNAGGRPVLMVAGDRDQFITTTVRDAQLAALEGMGISVEGHGFEGGHEIDADTLMRIAHAGPPKGV